MLHELNVDFEMKISEGFNLLQLAVKKGSIQVAQQLIKYGADSKVIDKQGNTLLHLAVMQGNLEIIELLINIGLDVNLQTIDGATVWSLAKDKKVPGIIKLFREYKKDDDSIDTSEHGLLSSVRNENIEDIKKHIANGNFIPGALCKSDASGSYVSPAHIAADKKFLPGILLLAKAGLDINIQHDDNGKTISHYAIEREYGEKFLLALKKEALDAYETLQPNLTDKAGNSLVHYAVVFGRKLSPAAQEKQLNLLRDIGAMFNVKNSAHRTPLFMAVLAKNTVAVRWLLNGVAASNAQDDKDFTPLHVAIGMENQVDTIPLLLGWGANINAQNNNNDTPLHLANRNEDPVAITLLLEGGADVTLQNNQGVTPVDMIFTAGNIKAVQQMFASSQEVSKTSAEIKNSDSHAQLKTDGFPVQNPRLFQAIIAVMETKQETLKQLVDDGLNVKTPIIAGYSLLHVAVLKGDIKIIEQLIKAGINVNLQTVNGMTVLYMAIQRLVNTQNSPQNYTEIIELLLKEENIDFSLITKSGYNPLYLALNLFQQFNDSKLIELLLKHKRVDIRLALGGQLNRSETPYKFITDLHNNIENYTDKQKKEDIQKLYALFTKENEIYDSKIIPELGSHLSDKELEDQRKLVDAVQKNDLKTVADLIALGVDLNGKTRNGNTALHVAAEEDSIEILKLLLDRVTADKIDLQNNSGNTAVHLASKRENEKPIALLLKSGANVFLENKKRQNPLSFMLNKYLTQPYTEEEGFKFKQENLSLEALFCLRVFLAHKVIEISFVREEILSRSNRFQIDQELVDMVCDESESRKNLSKKYEKVATLVFDAQKKS